MEKIYTIKDIAEILRVDKQTVMKNIKDNKLKHIKVGKQYRIKETQLEEFLNN